MAILEKIAVWYHFNSEAETVALITNNQHENSVFYRWKIGSLERLSRFFE